MSAQNAFDTLKSFFESRAVAKQALSSVREGVEIGVVIGDSVDCAVYRRGDQPVIEQRAAHNPDVVFHIQPESIYVLSHRTKDDLGDVGVGVLKEILAGQIRVKIPGQFKNILMNGYLDLLRRGGAPVRRFLARHGLASLPKIASAVKRLKNP